MRIIELQGHGCMSQIDRLYPPPLIPDNNGFGNVTPRWTTASQKSEPDFYVSVDGYAQRIVERLAPYFDGSEPDHRKRSVTDDEVFDVKHLIEDWRMYKLPLNVHERLREVDRQGGLVMELQGRNNQEIADLTEALKEATRRKAEIAKLLADTTYKRQHIAQVRNTVELMNPDPYSNPPTEKDDRWYAYSRLA
jgi:hypothetical protein